MNILLDLTDDEISLLKNTLIDAFTESPDGKIKPLIIKFEQAVDDGTDGFFNWIKIPKNKKEIPEGVIFGVFNSEPWIGATHYFKPIEADK